MPSEGNVGTPHKSLAKGVLDQGDHEQEQYGLQEAGQDLCWKMSQAAYGDFFEFSGKKAVT